MGKGDSNINYPAQPSYGEGMADALKAQVELLTGTGDFASTGSLESLLPLEESIRKKTAQTDTDILRQTLLGGSTTSRVVKDPKTGKYGMPDGEVVTSISGSSGSRYQVIGSGAGSSILDTSTGGQVGALEMYKKLGYIEDTGTQGFWDRKGDGRGKSEHPLYKITQKGADAGIELDASGRFESRGVARITKAGETGLLLTWAGGPSYLYDQNGKEKPLSLKETSEVYRQLANSTDKEIEQTFNFTNPNTGEPLKAGETITTRTGDGMIDLLGDNRKVQEFETRNATQSDVDAGLADKVGAKIVSQKNTTRQAGFDENNNFLGLSAMAEDIQRGNLSRQREADLQDVARLEPLFGQIMESYKPGTSSAMKGAKDLIEAQEANLLGAGAIDIPTGSTYGEDVTSKGFDAATNDTAVSLTGDTSYTADEAATTELGYTAAQASDPMTLTAATSYDPSVGVTGSGYEAVAGLDGGQIKADSLRAALMADAEAALGQGLTSREERQIAEAARARSTMMGRTFDQSGAIAEAQARVAEDNARKMQNRGFAQQALGQEAGLQESDLGRGLQAGMQNQAAKNQALQYTAGQDMQAQLANQGATNQALQAGMAAGLSQEALTAQQKQAQDFANMQAQNQALGFTAQQQQAAQFSNQQATNRASEFGVGAGLGQEQTQVQLDQARLQANQQAQQQASLYGAESTQQAALRNQQQQQQANQFGVGATMDAQRVNEQLKQQGLLGYLDAASRVTQIENQGQLDPLQAILGRGGGGSLQAGQGVFGQASYGLNSQPQYLNPESGLGYIQNQATNAANMYNAQVGADAQRSAGIMGGLGALGGGLLSGAGAAASGGATLFGGFCWVAREVYGEHNPAWMAFRFWMLNDSPSLFKKAYIKYGERFANFISDKPRLKARIRTWMDSKIGR